MTIAIGLQVFRGVVLCADTLVVYPDGRTTEESKITPFVGQSGTFAVANASNDLNATKTMVNSLVERLRTTQLSNAADLQSEVSEEMLTWYGKFPADHRSEILIAAKLKGGEPRLYYSEPPATFLEVSDGYRAAGVGATITDSLQPMLFASTGNTTIQVALRQAAYLLYRSKKENAFCGKRTTCVVLGYDSDEPIIVTPVDMQLAENSAGQLDFILQCTATLYLASTEETIQKNSDGIADMLRNQKTFRINTFKDIYGREISL